MGWGAEEEEGAEEGESEGERRFGLTLGYVPELEEWKGDGGAWRER